MRMFLSAVCGTDKTQDALMRFLSFFVTSCPASPALTETHTFPFTHYQCVSGSAAYSFLNEIKVLSCLCEYITLPYLFIYFSTCLPTAFNQRGNCVLKDLPALPAKGMLL